MDFANKIKQSQLCSSREPPWVSAWVTDDSLCFKKLIVRNWAVVCCIFSALSAWPVHPPREVNTWLPWAMTPHMTELWWGGEGVACGVGSLSTWVDVTSWSFRWRCMYVWRLSQDCMTLIRNVVEGIPALDKGWTRWPLRLFQLLSFYDTLKFLGRKPAVEGIGCESQACNCWKITLKSNHIKFTLNFISIELTMFYLTFGAWGVKGRTGRLLPHKMQKTMKIASTVQIFKKICFNWKDWESLTYIGFKNFSWPICELDTWSLLAF